MFERFTDQARRVVLAAESEARTLGNNFVSTEHLLLGLLDEADGEGLAIAALDRLGIDLAALRQRALRSASPVRGRQAAVLPASPRVSTVYQFALKEALRFGHNHVGTEHLLLGLACESDGVAAQVLAAFGADEKQLRRQVVAALRGRPA
jgi:ATP-dependent Clp protease ATP-binding subunit ClpC